MNSEILWFLIGLQCLIWILHFSYVHYLAEEIAKKNRQVMHELLQSIQDKPPAQRTFLQDHAIKQHTIVERAKLTGRWPEDEPSK